MSGRRRSGKLRRGQEEIRIRKLSIVGAGSVGSTLGVLLYSKGFEIVSIVNRSLKPAVALAKSVRCKNVTTSVADIEPASDMLLITVADDSLAGAVRELAKDVLSRDMLVIHTSGVHSLDALGPLRNKGARVGSLHPIQTFPGTLSLADRVKSTQGISFGIEGNGKVLKSLQRLVKILGGKSVVIPKGMKALYHVACVFASNYIVTLLHAAEEAAGRTGLGRRWDETFLPLFFSTVENTMKLSPSHGLTGPIARGDVHTIKLHLEALQKFAPQLLPVYSVLGIETARLAKLGGRLTAGQVQELVNTIRRHVRRYAVRSHRRRTRR